MIKVEIKSIFYENNSLRKTNRNLTDIFVFPSYLVPLCAILKFNSQQMWYQTICIMSNFPFVQTIELFHHQQWYQKPRPFERHSSGLVTHRLSEFSTGTIKVIRKPVDLPQWLGLLHYGKLIEKCLVF